MTKRGIASACGQMVPLKVSASPLKFCWHLATQIWIRSIHEAARTEVRMRVAKGMESPG